MNIKLLVSIIAIVVAGALLWNTPILESVRPGNPPNSAEGAPEGSIHNLPLPAGVSAAKARAAQDFNTNESGILILTAFEREWPNSCLGLPQEGEFCAEVITPGYEVTMQINGSEHAYRTNLDGSVVRREN